MDIAYKYRLKPTKEQKELIWGNINGARKIYNLELEEWSSYYEEHKDETDPKKKYPKLSYAKYSHDPKYPELEKCDSQALGYAQKHLQDAWKNFFREIEKGNHDQGKPIFKNYHKCSWSYSTRWSPHTKNNSQINEEKQIIRLPKIGWVKYISHRPLPDGFVLMNATISMTRTGKYYISLGFNVEDDVFHGIKPDSTNQIGLDMGIKNAVITSNGKAYINPKFFEESEKKIARLQRSLNRKKRGSMNYRKIQKKIAKEHEKIANQRNAYLHNISNEIITENNFIAVEDLSVKSMSSKSNRKVSSKHVLDVGMYELRRQLQYKSDFYDRHFEIIDRYYASSQICGECGYKNKNTKNLNVRNWICPSCGKQHDRDINAANNILRKGLEKAS